jgi:hypothetical protein
MKMQSTWYLALLAGIGVYEFPEVMRAWQGEDSSFAYLDLGWFLWLLHLLPEVDPARRPPEC